MDFGRTPGWTPGALLASIRLIAFDFDGVVVETTGLKLRAFTDLFPPDGRIAAYLASSQGRPRRERFAFVYREILGREYTPDVESELDSRLSIALERGLGLAPLLPAVDVFVRAAAGRWPLVVVSAAPERDVCALLVAHGLNTCFRDVHAGVGDKAGVLRSIVESEACRVDEVLFFGDTVSDHAAATAVGLRFVGVRGPSSEELLDPGKTIVIRDFTGFADSVMVL